MQNGRLFGASYTHNPILCPIAKNLMNYQTNPVISGNTNKLTKCVFCSIVYRIKWITMRFCVLSAKKQSEMARFPNAEG